MQSRRTVLGAAFGVTLGVAGTLAGRSPAVGAVRTRQLGYRHVATRRPAVALTFDDGPDPRFTPTVLDLLAAHQAHATFFVVGTGVHEHPDLVRRAVAEGHEVANHTLAHERLDHLDRVGVRAQLDGGAAALTALDLGPAVRPRLVRPPFGFEGPASRAELLAGGWEVARWHGCLERHLLRDPPGEAAARLAAGARPGDLLLAHDGGADRSTTVQALPDLLTALALRGLAVTTIATLQAGSGEMSD